MTFVVCTDCERCTTPISTNWGIWKRVFVGERERVGRVSSHAVSRWSRSPECFGRGVVWVGDFFRVFMSLHFQIHTPRAVNVDSMKGLRQPANLPTENARPPVPTYSSKCTVYCAPTREIWRPRLISKLAHSIRNQSHRNNSSSFEIASCHCSRDRELRQTYARGTSSHVF